MLLQVFFFSSVCFWDAARHNNDEKITSYNALIWESQDLSDHPRIVCNYLAMEASQTFEQVLRGKD